MVFGGPLKRQQPCFNSDITIRCDSSPLSERRFQFSEALVWWPTVWLVLVLPTAVLERPHRGHLLLRASQSGSRPFPNVGMLKYLIISQFALWPSEALASKGAILLASSPSAPI